MADTSYLKSIVEDQARGLLKERFGQSFASRAPASRQYNA